jgi:inorganic pyrophosphatase
MALMQEPVQPLSILHVRPIGMMNMIDEGENDENIICVLVDDPQYSSYTHVDELPEHVLREAQQFFEDYKILEQKETSAKRVVDPEEATETVRNVISRYDEHKR